MMFIAVILFTFAFGFGCGYEEGMKSMKEIDDRIIEEISETIYVKEKDNE